LRHAGAAGMTNSDSFAPQRGNALGYPLCGMGLFAMRGAVQKGTIFAGDQRHRGGL